jgi:saccharopepsin
MKFLILILLFIFLSLSNSKKRIEIELKSRPSPQKSHENMQQTVESAFQNPNLSNKRFLKSITKDITNFKDLQYYGDLYLGPNKQRMTFIYDTGSSWLWVPTDLCKQCPTKNKYKMDVNSTKVIDTTPEILVYGTGEVGGIRITEDVYLYKNSNKVVKDLVMLGIVMAQDIEGDAADGILGLGPMKTIAGRGNFVTALKQQGLIDYEIFSFDFKTKDEKSKMIFGDIDTSIVANFHDIIWVPLEGEVDDYWNLPLRGAYYGESNKTLQRAKYAVIDTGSSTMALSENNFLDFMQNVLDTGLECGFFIEEKFVA